jgi:alcohol dehydrogenase class IV
MGVETSWYAPVIAGALKDHCHATNPRLATAEDYQAMLEASM